MPIQNFDQRTSRQRNLKAKGLSDRIILQWILNSRVTVVCTPFHKWLCKNVAVNMWKFNSKLLHTTFIYQLMSQHVSALTVGHLQGAFFIMCRIEKVPWIWRTLKAIINKYKHCATIQSNILEHTAASKCEGFPTFRELRPYRPGFAGGF
jgi:hypothetical protein